MNQLIQFKTTTLPIKTQPGYRIPLLDPSFILAICLGLSALLLLPPRVSASPFFFSTGSPDGLIGTLSRPASAGMVQTETADDFVLIDSAGMMLDKNQSLQMLKDGSVKYNSIDVKDEKLRRYGNTVIYNGLGEVKLTVHGQEQSGDQRVTIVWAKQKGQWKRVSFQATPVIPAGK